MTMTTDGRPAISVGTLKERLSEARNVAQRLPLATPGERQLRALVVEICTMLVGDDHPMLEDLTNSGALYEAPQVAAPSNGTVRYHVTQHAPPPARAQAPVIPSPRPPSFQPQATAGVQRHVQQPTRPLTIDEAARAFVATPHGAAPAQTVRASSPAASEAPAAPIPIRPPATTSDGNPDPEGEAFLASLEERLNEEGG